MAQIPAGTGGAGKLSSQQGAVWEHRARLWLESQGLQFVAANVRGRWGEIDLIMKHRHVIVFVEVRYRRSACFGGAAASVTQAKQHKLLQTARGWLARQSQSFDTVDCRFDVLAFTGDEVEWIENAFSA
ncbi:YraN family protein [Atlantibacter sp.]|uniref:YraN family protein n=1 Tax=Atlantibacter sp. TaxID=1903473 RepID=UPI0028A81837|nr:YraN family protein [Atlantibacter sp.]